MSTLATPKSGNAKLNGKRPVSATYRTEDTCSSDCVFNRDGKRYCYAANGPGGGAFALANRAGKTVRQAFDRLRRESPTGAVVRHLVSGDIDGEYVREANLLHSLFRSDLKGYGYTHKWKEGWIAPLDVEGWTLNASCESVEDIEKALANGWQAVVESPVGNSLAGQRVQGRRVVTCPNQRDNRVKCSDCNLCSSDTATRPVVEFLLHGAHQKDNIDAVLDRR